MALSRLGGMTGSENDTVRQAGAIAMRATGDAREVLLVRARRNPNHWIFPKGHVELGETAEAAALRELREEAGVEGAIAAHAGTLEFSDGTRRLRVDYYLVESSREAGPREGRAQRWCRPDEALRLLSFLDARDLLTRNLPLIHGRRG